MEQPKEELHIQGGDQPDETPQQESKDAPPAAAAEAGKEGEKKGSSVLSAPSSYGNAAGDAIQGTLGKVGNPLGKGLETVAAPVGGIVDPLVGGLFRSPENFAKAADESKSVESHNEDLQRPIAGEEQTARNPLGLNQKGGDGGE